MNKPIDFVIISYNTKQLTLDCINSIIFSAYEYNFSITVVDNNSSDETVSAIKTIYPEVNIIELKENLGYAKAVNIGMKNTFSKFTVVLNADVIFLKDTVKHIFEAMESDEKIAVCGVNQQYPNGDFQRSFGQVPSLALGVKDFLFISHFNHHFIASNKVVQNITTIDVGYADGAILCFRRELFNSLNGFDEDYFFYTEEADFCHRAQKAGYRVILACKATAIHYRGASSNKLSKEMSPKSIEMLIDSKVLFTKKHLPNWERRAFIHLEKYHFLTLFYIASLLLLLTKNADFEVKKNNYRLLYKKWSEIK